MSKHSTEPWELSQLYPNSGLVLLRDAHDAAERVIGEFRLREDAQHAIDCHQALAGMKLEKLGALVEVVQGFLNAWEYSDTERRAEMDVRASVEAVQRALSELASD